MFLKHKNRTFYGEKHICACALLKFVLSCDNITTNQACAIFPPKTVVNLKPSMTSLTNGFFLG